MMMMMILTYIYIFFFFSTHQDIVIYKRFDDILSLFYFIYNFTKAKHVPKIPENLFIQYLIYLNKITIIFIHINC